MYIITQSRLSRLMPNWNFHYNEETGQEGKFWYHLFFYDRNKAVSQLERYTVIIVYRNNCIMLKQVIFPRKQKSVFPMTPSPPSTQKLPYNNVHLKSGSFRCCMSHVSSVIQHSRTMPVSASVSCLCPQATMLYNSSLKSFRVSCLALSSSLGANHVK